MDVLGEEGSELRHQRKDLAGSQRGVGTEGVPYGAPPGEESCFCFAELQCTSLLALLSPSCPADVLPQCAPSLRAVFPGLFHGALFLPLVVQADENGAAAFEDCKLLVLTLLCCSPPQVSIGDRRVLGGEIGVALYCQQCVGKGGS